MKSLVGAFNQEKALVGAFSVFVQPVVEPMDRFAALILNGTIELSNFPYNFDNFLTPNCHLHSRTLTDLDAVHHTASCIANVR